MKEETLLKRIEKRKLWINYNKNIPTSQFINYDIKKKRAILKELERDKGMLAVYEYRLKRLKK
jgi:hypothetical protein